MDESPQPLLVVAPNIGIASDGKQLFMDIKATEGCIAYSKFWPGQVRCLGRQTDVESISYGRWYNREDLPFEVSVMSANADGYEMAEHARGASLLMAGADHHLDLNAAEAMGTIPVVMIIEYTLRTRLQTNRVSGASPSKRLRTIAWILNTERKRRRVLANASGLQANGWPAFAAYGSKNRSSVVFFDTRLRTIISHEEMASKVASLHKGEPLRLAFSGRLERMKGADHLIQIAHELNKRGCRFSLAIYGDGSLRSAMQKDIKEAALETIVSLHGPVDFETVLVPTFKSSVDLFLCCHPQGDPSCTYLETLGCGVPIVGYNNEAWRGILGLGSCGVGIADSAAMVREIIRLDHDRDELGRLMLGAAAVAESRTFEKVYAKRIDHLKSIAFREQDHAAKDRVKL